MFWWFPTNRLLDLHLRQKRLQMSNYILIQCINSLKVFQVYAWIVVWEIFRRREFLENGNGDIGLGRAPHLPVALHSVSNEVYWRHPSARPPLLTECLPLSNLWSPFWWIEPEMKHIPQTNFPFNIFTRYNFGVFVSGSTILDCCKFR